MINKYKPKKINETRVASIDVPECVKNKVPSKNKNAPTRNVQFILESLKRVARIVSATSAAIPQANVIPKIFFV